MAPTWRDSQQAGRELPATTHASTGRPVTVLSGSDAVGVHPTAHKGAAATAGGSEVRTRIMVVDSFRGYAVLLMALDHLLVVVDPGHPLRWTVTRLSLPLFGLCAGFVLSRATPAARRHAVLVVGLLVTPVSVGLGLGQPDVLLVFWLALIVGHATVGRVPPSLVAAVGILSAVAWPLPTTGYHPGYVLAFVACGMALRSDLEQRDRMAVLAALPAPGFLTAIGRRPLAFYAGHLVALYLLFLLLGWVPAVGLGGELL